MKTKRTKEIKNYAGLEYVTVLATIKESAHGDVIDISPTKLEQLVAETIIQKRIPLRGKEVKFLRKVLGLSMEKFASEIGLTSGSVFKWEKASEERLHSINEIAVRAFIAEKLGIEISGKYSSLVGTDQAPDTLFLKAS